MSLSGSQESANLAIEVLGGEVVPVDGRSAHESAANSESVVQNLGSAATKRLVPKSRGINYWPVYEVMVDGSVPHGYMDGGKLFDGSASYVVPNQYIATDFIGVPGGDYPRY